MNVPKLFKQNLISTLKQNLLNALQPIQTYEKNWEFLLLTEVIKIKARVNGNILLELFYRYVYNVAKQNKNVSTVSMKDNVTGVKD